nr:uncharacterized protein CI109_002567 [Kwoniella shandongensis]KAA5529225.1 hypothetical protein CI109_002567 [Kwoniella shandongensis]
MSNEHASDHSDDAASSGESDTDSGLPPSPVASRRAIFKRIDTLAEAEYRGGYGQAPAKPSDGDPSVTSPDPTMLSPKITLSVDPTPLLSRLDSVRPTPIDTSGLQPTGEASDKPSSPITLLSPKPLPNPSVGGSTTSLSGSLFRPDTHLEVLIRLLYTFCRANPQWPYQASFVDTASTLYLIYTGGKKVALRHGEEQTFWALAAVFGEIDSIVDEEGINSALDKLIRRLSWANRPFATILRERNVEPALYAYRWLSFSFTRDLSLHSVPLLWDFIFAEMPSTPDAQPKVDLLVDVAVAMVLLLKEQLLSPPQHQAANGLWESEPPEEDADTALVRCLSLLRSYPLQSVGGIKAVLQTASQLREARLGALRNGNDPDQTPLPQVIEPTRTSETKSSPSSWSRAAGSLWNSIASQATSISTPAPKAEPPSTPRQAVDSHFRQSSHQRDRSDSGVSSVTSIQERLANLTSPSYVHKTPPPFTAGHSKSSSLQSPLPRPLLLSGSARRASRSERRDSSPLPSPRTSPPSLPADGTLSPPMRAPSPSAGNGLYRIGSRQRSSLSASPTHARDIRRDLDYGDATP